MDAGLEVQDDESDASKRLRVDELVHASAKGTLQEAVGDSV